VHCAILDGNISEFFQSKSGVKIENFQMLFGGVELRDFAFLCRV